MQDVPPNADAPEFAVAKVAPLGLGAMVALLLAFLLALLGLTGVSHGGFGQGGLAWIWFSFFAACALGLYWMLLRVASRLPPRALLLTAVLAQAAVLPAAPFTSKDIHSNLAYGAIVARGGNPFLVTPRSFFAAPAQDPFARALDPRWMDTACAYGPLTTALAGAAVKLGESPRAAFRYFKGFAAFAALLTLGIAWWMTRKLGRPAWFALLGLNPLFAWELTGQAHNDGFVLPLLLLFVLAVRRDQVFLAAVAAAISFLIKPVLLPVFGLWLVSMAVPRRPWRLWRVGGVVTICAVLVTAGWLPFWTGHRTLSMAGKALIGGHVEAANSLAEMIWHLAILRSPAWREPALDGLRMVGFVMVAGMGARALARVYRGHDALDEGLFVLLVLLGVVAWFQPWYVLWTFPFALICADRRLARIAAIYGAAFLPAYATGLIGTSWLIHAGLLVALWRRRSQRRRPGMDRRPNYRRISDHQ
jgi:hypothetical protein